MLLDSDKTRYVAKGVFTFEKEVCDVYITCSPIVCFIVGKRTETVYFKLHCRDMPTAKKTLRKELARRFNEQFSKAKIANKKTNDTILMEDIENGKVFK